MNRRGSGTDKKILDKTIDRGGQTLFTGSKSPETLRFYENAGYNSSDKTAFIQWLGMD